MGIRRVDKIDDLVQVKHALITCSDKSGLETFVPGLLEACPGLKMFSTGGTKKRLYEILGEDADGRVIGVDEYTGMPETAGGLVKTLHHKIFLGELCETYCDEHQRDMRREGAVPIDLVVCNLYPFSKAVARDGADFEDARGNIDIGGPSNIRALAKNALRGAVVVDPEDYTYVLSEIKDMGGMTDFNLRFALMQKVFARTAAYDTAIAEHMMEIDPEDAKACYDLMNRRDE